MRGLLLPPSAYSYSSYACTCTTHAGGARSGPACSTRSGADDVDVILHRIRAESLISFGGCQPRLEASKIAGPGAIVSSSDVDRDCSGSCVWHATDCVVSAVRTREMCLINSAASSAIAKLRAALAGRLLEPLASVQRRPVTSSATASARTRLRPGRQKVACARSIPPNVSVPMCT